MTRFPCRCRQCGARKTLRRDPATYAKDPRCSCGGLYRVDHYRRNIEHKRTNCHCDGYPWMPHRRGSLKCNHYCGPAPLENRDDRY